MTSPAGRPRPTIRRAVIDDGDLLTAWHLLAVPTSSTASYPPAWWARPGVNGHWCPLSAPLMAAHRGRAHTHHASGPERGQARHRQACRRGCNRPRRRSEPDAHAACRFRETGARRARLHLELRPPGCLPWISTLCCWKRSAATQRAAVRWCSGRLPGPRIHAAARTCRAPMSRPPPGSPWRQRGAGNACGTGRGALRLRRKQRGNRGAAVSAHVVYVASDHTGCKPCLASAAAVGHLPERRPPAGQLARLQPPGVSRGYAALVQEAEQLQRLVQTTQAAADHRPF